MKTGFFYQADRLNFRHEVIFSMNPIHKDRRVSYSFLMVLVFMGSGCGSPVSAQSLTIHPSAYVRPSQYTDCIPDVSSFLYYTDSRNLGKEDRDLGMKAAKSRAEELCADPNFAADFKNILACSQNINLGKGYYGNSEDFLNYCKDEESQKNAKAVGACRSQMFWAMNISLLLSIESFRVPWEKEK